MDRSGTKDVQEKKQSMVRLNSHPGADEQRLVSCFDQIDVFSEMFSPQRFFKVLQLNLSELKFVVLCVLLSDSGIAMLQTVDFVETAGVSDTQEVRQID